MHLIELSSREELLAATGPQDAFARLDPPSSLRGWALHEDPTEPSPSAPAAVAVARSSGFRPPSLFAWGSQVGSLLDALIDAGALDGLAGVSVPWEDRHEAESRFDIVGGGDWDWMWTDAPPPAHVSPALPLVELDDLRDAAEIAALGAENPRFEGMPGHGFCERWLGVRDASGALIACGAVQRLAAGTAHLGGILVAARHRRRGLGSAISAALTADMVRAEGVCTLGMYSDNDAARALYTRLGYRADKAWASRTLHRAHAASEDPTHPVCR